MLGTQTKPRWHKTLWRACAGALSAACLAAPAFADTDDDGFDDRVRTYLLANPEVILEALDILSKREARAAVAAKMSAHTDLFSDPAILGIGPMDASMRVVEFFDYRCAPCKVLHPKLIKALEPHPDIRVEMRHLPILSPGSERGARFALAVKNTASAEAYVAVHNDLWQLRGPLQAIAFQKIAQTHNLDWETIKAEMSSDAVSRRITQNRDIAIDLGILGTPAFATPTSISFGQSDAVALVDDWLNQ